jgi:hypothetical protein
VTCRETPDVERIIIGKTGKEAFMDDAALLTACHDAGVRLARFLYCDNGGLIRGKATGLHGLANRLHDGIGLTVAMMAMNSLDQLQTARSASTLCLSGDIMAEIKERKQRLDQRIGFNETLGIRVDGVSELRYTVHRLCTIDAVQRTAIRLRSGRE